MELCIFPVSLYKVLLPTSADMPSGYEGPYSLRVIQVTVLGEQSEDPGMGGYGGRPVT